LPIRFNTAAQAGLSGKWRVSGEVVVELRSLDSYDFETTFIVMGLRYYVNIFKVNILLWVVTYMPTPLLTEARLGSPGASEEHR
jgi:hypothetical protein